VAAVADIPNSGAAPPPAERPSPPNNPTCEHVRVMVTVDQNVRPPGAAVAAALMAGTPNSGAAPVAPAERPGPPNNPTCEHVRVRARVDQNVRPPGAAVAAALVAGNPNSGAAPVAPAERPGPPNNPTWEHVRVRARVDQSGIVMSNHLGLQWLQWQAPQTVGQPTTS